MTRMSGRSASTLDQVVKGAAPLSTPEPPLTSRSPPPAFAIDSSDPQSPLHPSSHQTGDPLASLPSSPPQIYLNLLILEASLRSQYVTLRERRRQNTFFLLLLTIWNAYFSYALFLQPREDGSGIGGSIYWMVEMAEKVALMGGVVTGILVWGTGQWERGVRRPRRFIGVTNRGLRTMNCKIILIKGPWWKDLLGHFSFLFPFHGSTESYYHYVEASSEKQDSRVRHSYEDEHNVTREEDLAPGGDCIKLLLLPKPFSADFRENWELYRTEYWEKENKRRTRLLCRLKEQERQVAREEGGWLWLLFGIHPKKVHVGPKHQDVEKHLKPLVDQKRRMQRAESHSRNASRSSTPANLELEERPPSRGSHGSRRGSFNDGRRRTKANSLGTQAAMTKSSLARASSSLSSSTNESI